MSSSSGNEDTFKRDDPLGATKRSLKTTTKDGRDLSEKKLRRLEKNRLSARECRRRKREATENMEHEMNVLEGENIRLRLQLQIGKEAEDTLRDEQERVTEEIDSMLKSGASEAEIYANIETFKEKFADYGRDKRSAIEFHLANIERLLMPTQTTSVAMRALQGTVAANNNKVTTSTTSDASSVTAAVVHPVDVPLSSQDLASLDPKAMFQYLVQYLDVTPEQASALKDSRAVAQELDNSLKTSLAVVGELRERLAQMGDDLATEFNHVRAILTPTQAAKFLVWVANNRACIHMLNELWGQVYPEPVTSTEDAPEESQP